MAGRDVENGVAEIEFGASADALRGAIQWLRVPSIAQVLRAGVRRELGSSDWMSPLKSASLAS